MYCDVISFWSDGLRFLLPLRLGLSFEPWRFEPVPEFYTSFSSEMILGKLVTLLESLRPVVLLFCLCLVAVAVTNFFMLLYVLVVSFGESYSLVVLQMETWTDLRRDVFRVFLAYLSGDYC